MKEYGVEDCSTKVYRSQGSNHRLSMFITTVGSVDIQTTSKFVQELEDILSQLQALLKESTK